MHSAALWIGLACLASRGVALAAPAAASALMAAAVYVVPAGTTRLVAGALGGAAVYAAALALLAPEDGREVRRLIGALRPAPRGRVSLGLRGRGSARTSRDPC